jgi:hypothetical protein
MTTGREMMNQLRRRVNYANVVSTIALLVALGGTSAWAVGQLPSRSVGARQLRPGAVTAKKLRKNAVTAPKIAARAVKRSKLANGAVSASRLGAAAVTPEKLAAAAVTNDKIADGAVTGAKVDENSLAQVPSARTAETATFADSADPAAFAAVDQEGNVDTSLSKGISTGNVKQGAEAGIYCVTVPPFSPRGAEVTPRYNGSGTVNVFVTIGGTGSCPAPEVEVQTFNGASRVREPFYIALYR